MAHLPGGDRRGVIFLLLPEVGLLTQSTSQEKPMEEGRVLCVFQTIRYSKPILSDTFLQLYGKKSGPNHKGNGLRWVKLNGLVGWNKECVERRETVEMAVEHMWNLPKETTLRKGPETYARSRASQQRIARVAPSH